jgi:hypothetical protein
MLRRGSAPSVPHDLYEFRNGIQDACEAFDMQILSSVWSKIALFYLFI